MNIYIYIYEYTLLWNNFSYSQEWGSVSTGSMSSWRKIISNRWKAEFFHPDLREALGCTYMSLSTWEKLKLKRWFSEYNEDFLFLPEDVCLLITIIWLPYLRWRGHLKVPLCAWQHVRIMLYTVMCSGVIRWETSRGDYFCPVHFLPGPL